MSKRQQYDYAVLNQAVYSNDPEGVLKKYGRDYYNILDETTNYLIVKDSRNGKINFVVKGTDIGDVKGMRVEDLKEDLHIVLNKPETMSRLKEQKAIAKQLVKKYGRNNVVITGHSLGGYITADIASDLGVKGIAFNIGSSPKKLIPSYNKNIVHYTTNDIRRGILDPLSMTSAGRDFYDKRRVKPKEGVGSGIIKYHTIEHFLPDITDLDKKEKMQKYNVYNNKAMNFEKRRDETENIISKTTISRAELEKLTDAEIERMSNNVSKGIRADTGIDKVIGGMNTGQLQAYAKKLGIKNVKKYKKRNKSENTLEDLKSLIRQKSAESSSSSSEEEEEMKLDKEGQEVPAGRRKEVEEQAYATLEQIRAEKAARRVAERLSSKEKREVARTGAISSNAEKLIREEAEIMEEKMRQSRLKADQRIDEGGLIDTSIYRNMGETPAQKILDQIADDRTNKQIAKDAAKRGYDTAKYLGSSGNQKELEKRLTEKGVPVKKIKEYKAVYDKVNKNFTEKKLEDGSWLTDSLAVLGAPEIKAYNEMVKLLGVDLSPKDRQDVRDLINGDYKGSTGNAVKILGQSLLSPDGWGLMIGTTAKKRATRVYNDFTDIWSKDDVYEERKQSEKDVMSLIEERKKKEKGDIETAKELARLRGEDYKGPEYRESERFNKSLGGPKLSDYGGQDDTAWYEKVGKFFVDAGLGVAEELLDPLGFIDIVSGKPTPKLQKLEQRLKEADPRAYAQYKRALEEHIKTLRKASVEDKNQAMIEDHKPVAKQLGNIMSAVLEENAKRLREGKDPIISKDQVEKYVNYSKMLKSGNVSYHQLAQIDYMFNSDMQGELPENLNDKYVQWQLEEENQLGKKGAGDSELSISKDTEALEQVGQIEEARKAEKQAQEQAIEESKKAYEMIRQEEIDAENEETLRKRKDVIHPGFVETQTNKPELRPKIVFGNTDAQFMQSAQEVKEEKELLNRMLMWKAGNMTEENDPSSILYKRYRENEDLRYRKTFAMPKPRPRDNRIPQQFLVYNERIWVPQYADKTEQLPMMRQPERAEAIFDRFEDYRADTSSMREQIANRRNIFPEPHLQGYKGPAIKQGGLKGFNRFRNNRYLGY
jgi:hypothetical protein